jgi:hypothetical protein
MDFAAPTQRGCPRIIKPGVIKCHAVGAVESRRSQPGGAARTLISIDLVIRNAHEEVLLGLRNNAPAQDSFFVPGGMIRMDELPHEAFRASSRPPRNSSASTSILSRRPLR